MLGRRPLLCPPLTHRDPIAADDNCVRVLSWGYPKWEPETPSADDHINRISLAGQDDRVRSNAIWPFAIRVEERDVVAIKCTQIFVVEGWPLAPCRIPRLELLGNDRVVNYLFYSPTDAFLSRQV